MKNETKIKTEQVQNERPTTDEFMAAIQAKVEAKHRVKQATREFFKSKLLLRQAKIHFREVEYKFMNRIDK